MVSKRLRTSTLESSSDSINNFLENATSEVLELFEEHLRKSLKMKEIEIRTLSEKIKCIEKSYEEKIKNQSEQIKKLESENKILSAENKKLVEDKTCDDCDKKTNIIEEQKKDMFKLKTSMNLDEVRWKNHIFRRQMKLKGMKKILYERDLQIIDLQDALEKKIEMEETSATTSNEGESEYVECEDENIEISEEERESPLISQIDSFLDSLSGTDDNDHSTKIDKIAKKVVQKSRGKKRNVMLKRSF